MSRAIVVVGTGSYVPAKVVTNEIGSLLNLRAFLS